MKAKNRRIAYLGVSGVVVLTLLGVATIVANGQGNNLDLVLGRGTKHVNDNSALNTNYINFTCTDQNQALAYAQEMTRKTAEEGMTLLRNDEVDPVTHEKA